MIVTMASTISPTIATDIAAGPARIFVNPYIDAQWVLEKTQTTLLEIGDMISYYEGFLLFHACCIIYSDAIELKDCMHMEQWKLEIILKITEHKEDDVHVYEAVKGNTNKGEILSGAIELKCSAYEDWKQRMN